MSNDPHAETERGWQAYVLTLARLGKWCTYHTYDSRRSNPGFPDLTMVRAPELIFAELKTDTGRITPAQRGWLDNLHACGAEVHVWRPRDEPAVRERLLR